MKIESILEISGGKASLHTITTLWDRPDLVEALKQALHKGSIHTLEGPSGGLHFTSLNYEQEQEKRKEEPTEQEVLDILSTCEDLMSISTLAMKSGISRDKTKRLVDDLCQAGKVYRSGERYGLTKEMVRPASR